MKKHDPNVYPPGLNAAKVKRIIAYYERQTEDGIIEEFEAASKGKDSVMIQVPRRLLPAVRKLLAPRKSA
jgi:hypothetical protein